MSGGRWVCLDVGETLIDETRVWSIWAAEIGVPTLTFFAALGAVIAGGGEHGEVFERFGVEAAAWRALIPTVEQRYGGFQAADLYPDALRVLPGLRAKGYRVAILANQPAIRSAELRGLGFDPDAMAMSDELGAAKPQPAFFRRALERLGSPPPDEVAYVGDRVDNDVLAPIAAGLRVVWLRRGPWGAIVSPPEGIAALRVASLDELVERIDEAWPAGEGRSAG